MSDGSMNLIAQRSDKSVWDKPSLTTTLSTYDQERWMAVACGTALAMFGARRGGVAGGFLAATGAALGVRAVMGRRDLSFARNWIDRRLKDTGWRPKDIVAGRIRGIISGQRLTVVDARLFRYVSTGESSAA